MTLYAILQQALILSIIWYSIARFFYLHHARKLAIDILDDEEYQRKSMTFMRTIISEEIDYHLFEKVDAVVPVLLKSIDPISELIEAINIPSFEWDEGMSKHFVSMLNGWYGSLHKAVERQTDAEDGEIKTAMEYANMNQGNPQALDMIQQALMKKSPILAMGMQLLNQGNNSNSRSPPHRGPGGY